MARKIKSGDVVQISLPRSLGWAYGMIINLLDVDPNASYPILLRVYNVRSTTPVNDVHQFIERDLILSPLLIAGILPAIRTGQWKIIGNLSPSGSDFVIPHYKRPEPDGEHVKEWFYVTDANISTKVRSNYEYVKHLETLGAIGSEVVNTKIAMALLKDENKDLRDYFDLKEYFEILFSKEVSEIPAYYLQQQNMRGHVMVPIAP